VRNTGVAADGWSKCAAQEYRECDVSRNFEDVFFEEDIILHRMKFLTSNLREGDDYVTSSIRHTSGFQNKCYSQRMDLWRVLKVMSAILVHSLQITPYVARGSVDTAVFL